jgi:anti-sigma-K factor RskA
MLPPYALGALEAEDARSLETHLAACAECRAELDEWRDTTAALAYAAERVEPSVRLRARILESVREQPSSSSAKIEADNGDGTSSAVSVKPSNVVSITQQPRSRMLSPVWKYGAIAASIAFVASLAFVFALLNRNSVMETEIARLSTRLNQIQGELARERESKELNAARAEQDMRMLTTATITTLKGTEF